MLGRLSHTGWPWDASTPVRQRAFPRSESPVRSHGACRGPTSGTERPIQGPQDGLPAGTLAFVVPGMSRIILGIPPADLR
jgi:hypothetical protein